MLSDDDHNSDGSDIFWPGYVDAVTNLVLNLLFLLTIMTVAVFMFALELGRASKGGPEKPSAIVSKKDAKTVSKGMVDPVTENITLKLEVQRLKRELAQQVPQKAPPIGVMETVDVTSTTPKPLTGLDKMTASDSEIIVRFKEDAIAFTPVEHDRLRESLKPMVASGKLSIFVDVPAGFTEAKRMGFYRAMAVRNLLIEMNLPKDRIDVSVRERKTGSNAAIVRVRPN